jgi:cyclic beta-1,2-glucan synthetase
MTADARLLEGAGRLAREHARWLAPTHPGSVRRRVAALERELGVVFERLDRERYPLGERPAAVEWLLDNGHLIQDGLAEVRRHLPRRFERVLPGLTDGPRRDRSRVEVVAGDVLDRLDGFLDLEATAAYLERYQQVAPLAIAELWAFPTLLRLVVLERLCPAARAAVGLTGDRPAPAQAAPARDDPTVERAVRSLRALSVHDWSAFVERVSLLERELRDDPAGVYPAMDFATRDRYRRAVEQLARRTPDRDELAVARSAVDLARAAEAGRREAHVGTYLIGEGRPSLEARIGHAPTRRTRWGRALAPHAKLLYVGAVAATTAAALALVPAWARAQGASAGSAALLTLLALVPAWSIAVTLVDWLVTLIVPPRRLPRMDPDAPVPASARTLVVVPVIVHGVDEVEPLLERLERHYLGNRGPNVGFALLSDLADAAVATTSTDAPIVAALSDGIRCLNERYADGGRRPFHLLHRERRWNPVARRWMGWERKRGKLEELNALVTGRGRTSFTHRVDVPNDLGGVRFVLTLDADTRLPPGAARALIATLRHPLVRPVLSADRRRLVAGYTVLQPRLEADVAVAVESGFARTMTGTAGIDPYAHPSADVHQDLFGESLFMGKGLYDVDAFERLVHGRVPENRLLSHDLFEGIHGRVALVSDVVLYEPQPANALTYALRLHRWVRGDWQLLPWLVARRPPGRDARALHGLRPFDRWKVAENLRRSLQAPALTALLIGTWSLVPHAAGRATVAILALVAAPVALSALAALGRALPGRTLRPAVRAAVDAMATEGARWALTVVMLPFVAGVVVDAIGRTLVRLYLTRRHLLEWTTAARAARRVGATLTWRQALRAMPAAPTLSAVVAAALARWAPGALPSALPVLAAWASAPAVAAWTSRPRTTAREWLSDDEQRSLRLLARRTWHFFDDLVGPRDHWLPPDHLQEDPGPTVAHRTSPTNVGMLLASTLGAYDLGFLDTRALADRVARTLDTLDGLERHRGHWLNWYGTRDLVALAPRYVSTVDSGNLAAALLVVARGLEEARAEPVPAPARTRGLADTVGVLADAVARLRARVRDPEARRALARQRRALERQEAALRAAARTPLLERRAALADAERTLQREAEGSAALLEADPEALPYAAVAELRAWWSLALREVRAVHAEIDASAPWLGGVAAAPGAVAGRVDPGTAAALTALTDALAEPTDLGGLRELAARARSLVADLERHLDAAAASPAVADLRAWGASLLAALDAAVERAGALDRDLAHAAGRCRDAAAAMDFAFLYDRGRDLFHLGHHVDRAEHDPNHYDLLASEARTASLLAIATGQAPLAHWMHLGRPLARVRGRRVLLSWSGTMFEYLMPRLFLRHPERTLLHESCQAAVAQQVAFARRHGVPWGISESAFAELGTQGDYQYRAFGVPGVGLARDLGRRLVVAPYASLLALPVRAREAMANVERLAGLGALGRYGLADAVDFGEVVAAPPDRWRGWPWRRPSPAPTRRPGPPHVVRTYMAHHQGMILVAAANRLVHDRMVDRLHALPEIASVELLLHERIPLHVPPPERWRHAEAAAAAPGVATPPASGWPVPARAAIDRAWPLSNGATTTVLRAAGGGGSRWGHTTLTRDRRHDAGGARGTVVYLRDLEEGTVWSTTLDPVGGAPDEVEVAFAAHAVRYRRRRDGLVAREEVVVADRTPVELRRVRVTNEGDRPRRVAVASYAEVVLGDDAEDARHPAFAKLFVESAFDRDLDALVCRRRPRGPGDPSPWLGHRLVAAPEVVATRSACTDRRAFVGRGGDLRAPRAPTLYPHAPPPTTGATLDPIVSIGCVLDLAPGASGEATFATAAGASREAVAAALAQASSRARVDLLVDDAEAAAVRELAALGLAGEELPALADVLALALAPHAGLRGDAGAAGPVLPVLWSLGVSGDLPVVVVRVGPGSDAGFVVRLLRGHAWWSGRQVGVDLVVLDEVSRGYDLPLRHRLEQAVRDVAALGRTQGVGRAVVVPSERLGDQVPTLLAAAAVVLDAAGPPLRAQLDAGAAPPATPPSFVSVAGPQPTPPEIAPWPPLPDAAFGGYGGFAAEALGEGETRDGDEANGDDVVLHLEPGRPTPAPWSHVVAHEGFGFLMTDSGAATTWGSNSGERRLTPWPNDPVRDPSGEAVYLRDEETGDVWSPTPRPAPGEAAYRARFGAGVATFEHRGHGLEQTFEAFVDPEAPVKLLTLHLRDRWDRPRRLTVTAYVEWVLGTSRGRQAPFLVPGFDAEAGTLTARTLLGPLADGSVAFLTASRPVHGLTGDRREFLGPEGDPARPAALGRIGLSGRVAFGDDPCAALQVHVDLEPGAATDLHFVLGLASDAASAASLARRFRAPAEARAARDRVAATWAARLGRVRVHTPDPALDHLLNRWLPYQALACRLWGRTALYQSSGAYGFRDQLQDAVNLAPLDPGLLRSQLLRAAAQQFEEGDVLHWWHPDGGAGVRTRCSDDLLWLPWATARYLERTGDEAVLHERRPYLSAAPLAEDEVERYDAYRPGPHDGTLLDHALRALDRGATRGPHGLPLIGSGDWNDGMNALGLDGRGESVWLGWFLHAALGDGATLCAHVGDEARAARYRTHRADLATALEAHAWDGDWYRRAFADDGSAIGSHVRSEARIDLIAQAWAVLSGAAPPERAAQAMASAVDHLWRRDDGVFLLLAPPFQEEPPDPGYIRAYPPGVRENGGQYTHGAVWGAWALADLGDGDAAVALLRALAGLGHVASPADAERYRVEPYVVAADVYAVGPYAGRGGWTWYTGSAGWLYRYGLERVLGVRALADHLEVDPCVARAWPGFTVDLRRGDATTSVEVRNPDGVVRGVAALAVDGLDQPVGDDGVARVPWPTTAGPHRVVVRLGARPARVDTRHPTGVHS